jgi:hypothetical protein
MTPKSGRAAREERERMLILKHKFENRIGISKSGKQALNRADYSTALQRFSEYMQVLADVKKVKDYYSLKPSHFDAKKDITEMMMMSQLFFEMARIYDVVPKFKEETKKCLDQFVAFSANQPYQVVNSELIRKHLKKSLFKNPDDFRAAYDQIFIQSKKCYVVSFCFGQNHEVTNQYRKLKDILLESSLGREAVRIYYAQSSEIVPRWEGSWIMHTLARVLIKPSLLLFSKTLLRFIIK